MITIKLHPALSRATALAWARRAFAGDGVIVAALGLSLVVLGLWGAWAALPAPDTTPPAALAPTPPLRIVMATPHAGPAFVAATVVYASPTGAALGAVEAGRSYRPLARYGAEWVQLDVAGSGIVWARVVDVGLPAGVALADLAPTPEPVIVVIERPAPAAQAAPAPLVVAQAAPTPEPTPAGCVWPGVPYAPDYCQPDANAWHAPMAPEGGD